MAKDSPINRQYLTQLKAICTKEQLTKELPERFKIDMDAFVQMLNQPESDLHETLHKGRSAAQSIGATNIVDWTRTVITGEKMPIGLSRELEVLVRDAQTAYMAFMTDET